MEKEKPHRHKWEQTHADCPKCGFADFYLECECGEVRNMDKKPL